jgi:hypothetical protein
MEQQQSQTLPVEKTLEQLTEATEKVFLTDPYLDAVAIVCSWKIGNPDLPFGLLLGRDGSVNSPATLVGISQQTGKMLMHQAMQITEMFETADQVAADLSKKIMELKGQLDASDSKQRPYEEGT